MTTPRSSFVARETSICWHTSTRTASLKPSNSAPCWCRAAPPTYVNAWCTPWTCFYRDAAKITLSCVRHKQTNWAVMPLRYCSAIKTREGSVQPRWVWGRTCDKWLNIPRLLRCCESAEVQRKYNMAGMWKREWNVAQLQWIIRADVYVDRGKIELVGASMSVRNVHPRCFGGKEGRLGSKDKCWAGTSLKNV